MCVTEKAKAVCLNRWTVSFKNNVCVITEKAKAVCLNRWTISLKKCVITEKAKTVCLNLWTISLKKCVITEKEKAEIVVDYSSCVWVSVLLWWLWRCCLLVCEPVGFFYFLFRNTYFLSSYLFNCGVQKKERTK